MSKLRVFFAATTCAFLSLACAHSGMKPKFDRASGLDLKPIAKRFGVPRCHVSVPLSGDELLRLVTQDLSSSPASREDWIELTGLARPGDQFRQITCLKGVNGVAAGVVFYARFRDGAMNAEMHTVIIN